MPHIVIEYTDNLAEQPDFRQLFAELHAALVETGDVAEIDIKSRAIRLTDWYVGDGNASHAFVHLKLYLINRRTVAFKRRALAALQPVVAAHFPRTLAERQCQLCFETIDMDGDTYAKIVSPQN
ncbi:5-carboxymethyl-2-hydroxymuconate Delta-isomerase [Chitinimonas viridis]|uniref:5-carboxymethyl-2-hydroxymuconate Delta-isomerase n=1 Tax=Chitinimonas viridis TaxID=664880 RepID=A0ABT8B275_9NEIS|nr:5-carboxymethyl-2-hydroxymuconate Delta-isomerase [Chitinimonas viridis]MDN3576337.1 5-carboxymethyl-2-hydroxymuconate Delta-isomerase [Chitinimonas viridis]